MVNSKTIKHHLNLPETQNKPNNDVQFNNKNDHQSNIILLIICCNSDRHSKCSQNLTPIDQQN